jgi:hypothetical protein
MHLIFELIEVWTMFSNREADMAIASAKLPLKRKATTQSGNQHNLMQFATMKY